MRHLDTCVVLDAADPESEFHAWSQGQIADAVAGEGAAFNSVALAEALVKEPDREAAEAAIRSWGVILVDTPVQCAGIAAEAFAAYLADTRAAGAPRAQRMPAPDFLIGAHAQAAGWELVTRDPRRFKRYFPGVRRIEPPVPSAA